MTQPHPKIHWLDEFVQMVNSHSTEKLFPVYLFDLLDKDHLVDNLRALTITEALLEKRRREVALHDCLRTKPNGSYQENAKPNLISQVQLHDREPL